MAEFDVERAQMAGQIKRTTISILTGRGQADVAAVLLDADWELVAERNSHQDDMHVSVAPAYFGMFSEEAMGEEIAVLIADVAQGHVTDWNGSSYRLSTQFKTRLLPVDPDWEDVVKAEIARASVTNQGLVTEAAFGRRGQDPIMYGELKFGSQSEVRIAQELEARKVLFFPLAVGVRAETGRNHLDHREADFIIVHNGVIGMLEVSGGSHNGKLADDSEKEVWFQRSGILCVKSYPAERCYNRPGEVVDEFLSLMAQYKR